MRATKVHLHAALSTSHPLLSRRGHGGAGQTRKALERMVLLEQARERPASGARHQPFGTLPHQHGDLRHAPSGATTTEVAAFLRGVEDRVADARRGIFGAAAPPGTSVSLPAFSTAAAGSSDASCITRHDAVTITSLSHFIAECKRLRVDVGLERRPKEREALRQTLRAFWRQHADSAVLCCQMWGRDFGFVAGHGLCDDGLHMSLPALRTGLATLQAEKEVSSCLDVMLSLDYITRELVWWERQVSSHGSSHERHAHNRPAGEEADTPTWEELVDLRHTVTDLVVERVFFFFLLIPSQAATAPSPLPPFPVGASKAAHDSAHALADGEEARGDRHDDTSTRGGSRSSTASPVKGTAQDVLSALEALARVTVADANQALLAELEANLPAQPTATLEGGGDGWRQRSARQTSAAPLLIDQSLLVTRVFLVLTTQRRRFLSFTALVQALALLRIFLPVLWPPYAHGDRTGRGTPASPRTADPPSTAEEHSLTPLSPSASPHTARHSLAREREALQRITWGLAVSLKKRDSHFTNPYHFVKIVATLARLPSFTLAPHQSASLNHGSRAHADSHGRQRAAPPFSPLDGGREMRSLTDLPTSTLFGSKSGGAPSTSWESGSIFARSAAHSDRENGSPQSRLPPLTAGDFWRYMVAKACIFVPALPLPQRRAAVRGLHKAIAEKRGKLLRPALGDAAESGGVVAVDPQNDGTNTLPHRTGMAAAVETLGDAAEDILLPLVDEMATLEESFHESLRHDDGARASHRPPPRQQRRRRPSLQTPPQRSHGAQSVSSSKGFARGQPDGAAGTGERARDGRHRSGFAKIA